jgi:glycosyltransferase involved in cell wall biosynthesis
VKDILLDGETGFVVPPRNATLFAEKLKILVESKNIRAKMSQNGWNYVQEKFQYTTLVTNMENYYAELLEKVQKNGK